MVLDDLPITYVGTPDLEAAIDTYTNELSLGYRLEMIKPADHPSEAWLTNGKNRVCIKERRISVRSKKGGVHRAAPPVIEGEWHTGRAGMEYRDLIPGRLGGKVIASHIRLTQDGEVPDYVHYHKVKFQMIYCLRGRIRVVYEDQGPPFWLEPGDCVLQPPEIRHRVLESTGHAEVVEIGMPAVHETWVEHEMELPTSEIKPDRDFSGQRFVRHIASEADWIASETQGLESRDTGISKATSGLANVFISRTNLGGVSGQCIQFDRYVFFFVTSGNLEIATHDGDNRILNPGEASVIHPNIDYKCKFAANTVVLE
ncbi:MAG: cupin domain-containing protein, partial [Acidobacteriota bacterium]